MDIEYFVSDAAKLKNLEDNSFDVVISNLAFMDIDNVDKTVKECSRILKKNGKIVFSLVNPIFGMGERSEDADGYFLKLRNLTQIISNGTKRKKSYIIFFFYKSFYY